MIVAILTGLGFSIGAFLLARNSEQQRAEAEFKRRAEVQCNSLRLNLQRNFETLNAVQALFQNSPTVSRQQFTECARDLIAAHREIQVVEWAPRVTADRRSAFEAAAQAEGLQGFAINDRVNNIVPVRAPQRAEYFPIYYVEPLAGNRIVMGFDAAAGLAATELRRAAQSGLPAASGRIRLVQDTNQFGMIVTLPVYSRQAGSRQVRGVVRGVYRISNLFEAAWQGISMTGIETAVLDVRASASDRLLYLRGVVPRGKNPAEVEEEMRSGLSHRITATIAGREWLFISRPQRSWWQSMLTWYPWILLGSGALFTGVLASYLNLLLRRAHTIERVVNERTARLEEANAALSEEVAARGHTEEQLRRSEAKLLDAQRIGRIGSWEVDLQRKQLSWSDEVYRLFGREKESFQPTRSNFLEAIHPEDRAKVEEASEGAIASGKPYHIEHRIVLPDGSERIVIEHAELVRGSSDGENGPVTHLLGTVQDITERKQAEERLTVERNLLETVIESLPDLMFVKDAKARYVRANKAHLQALGATNMYAVIGKTDADFLPAEAAAVMVASDLRVIETGEPLVNHEALFAFADGQRRWILTTKVPYRDANGQVAGLVGISRDVTDRKHAEDERSAMDRKFQETQKLESLGVLAGGIAHDFNNLLTGILGNASLASFDLPAQSPIHSYMEQIEKASLRAADLCKQMLAYSGKGRFVIQAIDLSALVQETLHLLQLSISKKAVLNLELAQEIPFVMADATQLRQIIMNLVINASEAIGDRNGTIMLRTSQMKADRAYLADLVGADNLAEGDYVVLDVTDNGCGMTPEIQQKVFEPFFTTKFTGRGLGLAAVLGIVRGHKGALKIYSEPDRGTSFKLLLPAAGISHPEKPLQRTGPKRQVSGTVLVVDDEEGVRNAVARMASSIGCQVLTASDGTDAVDVYRTNGGVISAVLLDLTMPLMDGEETFREIRRLNPNAFVLLMSGFNEQDAIGRFVGKGLAGFLQKPFTRDQLTEKLAALSLKS